MNKPTILIVEDEAIVAADLASKLGRLGYEVVGITSRGEEAVELACRLRPKAILMDIRLKGAMDGFEAANVIRGSIQVPVVFLTGQSDIASQERARNADPSGYILKPFDELELESRLKVAISGTAFKNP